MKGGSANAVIPFLKRVGMLGADGSPTELYQQFRNPDHRGAAAATALRTGYAPLYEINEYVHDLDANGVKGVIVQATGLPADAKVVGAMVGSFKALRDFADFEAPSPAASSDAHRSAVAAPGGLASRPVAGLSLGYTINLHLPATSDVAVFNAIFKSLREHLLQDA